MKTSAMILFLLCIILQDTFSQGDERLTKLTEYELDGTFKADNVCMQGDYLYAISDFSVEEMKIFNISDPSNPVEVGNHLFDFDMDPGSLIIDGDVLYIGSNVSGTKDVSFAVMDVSDPTNPSVLKSYFDIPRVDDASKTARQVTGLFTMRDDIIYAKSGTFNLIYIDVSDPLNAKVIGGYGDSFGSSLISGIDQVKIIDDNNAWLDRNDFRHASVASNGTLSVGSNQGVTGELYDFEFLSGGDLGYAATWQGSAANVLTFSNNNNTISELDIIDVDDSIGGFGFSAEVEIFEKANLLFVQAVTDFLVLDISDKNNPDPVLSYEGDSYLRIHRDFLVVQGFNGSMIFYRIDFDNEGPTISDQTFSINETDTNGTSVGIVQSSDMDDDPLVFTIISGNDEGTFQIDEDTGEITVADDTQLDFDTQSSYTLTIRVSDGFESSTALITIDILEINLEPEIGNQSFSIPEQYFDQTVVGEVQASDPEGEELTYSIVSGNDLNLFSINSETGVIELVDGAFLDYDANPSHILTIEVSDGAMTSSAEITIDIIENQAPELEPQTFFVRENLFETTFLGTIEASDEEEDVLQFNIIGGNSLGIFSLDSQTGELFALDNDLLDFANSPTLEIGVEVFDGLDVTTATMTIEVEENQDPEISEQAISISENTPNDSLIGTIEASDEEGDPITYEISNGNDLGTFGIDVETGELRILDNEILNFANSPTLYIEVSVFDGLDTSAATITIDVTENFAPEITDQSFTISENTPNGIEVGSIQVSDANDDELMFSFASGNESSAFNLDGQNGIISVADSSKLNFLTNPEYIIATEVFDGQKTAAATITITLTENSRPTASDAEFSAEEDLESGSTIGSISASDPNNDLLNYTILSGDDDGVFEMDATGKLKLGTNSSLDFESTSKYELEVSISDGKLGVRAFITVNVTDVNELPEISDQTFSIDENSLEGTQIGVLDVNDPEGEDLLFGIDSGNSDGFFSLDENTGLIEVDKDGLNFEEKPSYALLVTIVDGQLSKSVNVTIDIIDVNESPTIEDQQFAIDENPDNDQKIGVLTTSDPEGDDLSYTIKSGNDNGTFIINGTGEIIVNDSTLVDFEINDSISLIIEVSDGELSDEATISIDLSDVNEKPVTEDQSFSLSEESEDGHVLGTIVSTDPEGDDLVYSVTSGDDNGIFSLNETTGELSVAKIASIDFENTTVITLTVEVSDGELSVISTLTIELEPKVVANVNLPIRSVNRVYPNPAKNFVHLDVAGHNGEYLELSIYSIKGSKILSKQFKGDKLDVSGLKQGLYILELSDNDEFMGRFKLKIER